MELLSNAVLTASASSEGKKRDSVKIVGNKKGDVASPAGCSYVDMWQEAEISSHSLKVHSLTTIFERDTRTKTTAKKTTYK